MECPSCLEIYDEYQRIPRNLPCGHTYCESCLEQLLFVKKKFECPICCTKLDPLSKPTSFSKNFVAAEISTKHRELQKKLLFCLTHEEPLRFFCQTCQVNICSSCILEHNGHFFAKQDHSGKSVNLAYVKCIASLLIQRAKEIKTKIGIKLEDLNNQMIQQKKSLDDLKQARDQNLKQIDSEFEVLLSHLLKRKATLKEDYHKTSEEKLAVIDSEVVRVHDFVESLTKKKEDISDYFTQLDKVKIVQGDLLEKELNKLEEVVNVELQNIKKNTPEFSPFLSNVIFDSTVYKELQKFGMMAQDVHNPRICYFGEKNKILIYDINADEWDMTQLSFGETYEFNYYSSAATLPNGSIILTGGESSNAVCQVYLTSYRAHKHPSVKIVQREPMNHPRKEHVSLYLSNSVYVLGGYNGKSNNFLNLCERYDLETGHWHPISSMIVPKCAFAATTLNNRYIFAVGGYNGTIRLNSIEKYDIKTDKWTMLDIKMKQSLSNSACFAYSEQSLMILGGGHNKGFSLEMIEFNIETQKWKKFKSMSDGKDLRNKVIVFNGEIFAIGGNNCLAEKFSLRKNDWELLSSYQSFVNDNLDSWACGLYYDMTKNVEEEVKPASSSNLGLKFTNPYANNYQLYGYDNMYDHEDPFSGQSSLSDDEENFD